MKGNGFALVISTPGGWPGNPDSPVKDSWHSLRHPGLWFCYLAPHHPPGAGSRGGFAGFLCCPHGLGGRCARPGGRLSGALEEPLDGQNEKGALCFARNMGKGHHHRASLHNLYPCVEDKGLARVQSFAKIDPGKGPCMGFGAHLEKQPALVVHARGQLGLPLVFQRKVRSATFQVDSLYG